MVVGFWHRRLQVSRCVLGILGILPQGSCGTLHVTTTPPLFEMGISLMVQLLTGKHKILIEKLKNEIHSRSLDMSSSVR